VAGLRCRFGAAELEIRFLADDVVRVSWGPDAPPEPWALGEGGLTGPRRVTIDGTSAYSPDMGVTVADDGSLRFLSAHGETLRHELPPLWRGAARTHRHLLRPGEKVTGLGEQAGGVERRGTYRLRNRDPGGSWGPGAGPLYCVIPVLVGIHPGGHVLAFYENPAEGVVRIGDTVGLQRVEVEFAGGMLRHYVCVGSLPTLAERYAALTGRPAMPPRWALGYHQSRWGYRNETDVRHVADGFRREGLPLSAVHLDIDYMDGYRVFTIDRTRFPNLRRLTAELAGHGTQVVTIVDPAVKIDPDYEVFREGEAQCRFVRDRHGGTLHGVVWPGRAAFPDFVEPETRRWWAAWYPALLDEGVAGVWHDMNEPTSISLWGDRTLPPDALHGTGPTTVEHRRCHNAYGLLMDEAAASAMRELRPDRRPFLLSRSGWAGVQRVAWNWTGDAETSWPSLRQQVDTIVGLGLSGVPFCGPDIGGFAGSPSGELYVRWLEMAVFLPFCRTHCITSAAPREPWAFPEPHRTAIGRLIRLRYRLLPYLYTLSEEASRLGRPLVRSAGWPSTVVAADTFLLGDALLVAPVTEDGARERRVELPPGGWVRWRPLRPELEVDGRPGEGSGASSSPEGSATGTVASIAKGSAPLFRDRVEALPTGGRADLDAPLGSPVVLARAGSIVPLDDGPFEDGRLTAGHDPRLLAFHCFPDRAGKAAGSCYDDAGDGSGPARTDRLTLVPGAGGLRTLRWERDGRYPAPSRVRIVVHGKAAVTATVDGEAAEADVVRTGTGSATVVECGPFALLELS
jgi:alpha-glucosidase